MTNAKRKSSKRKKWTVYMWTWKPFGCHAIVRDVLGTDPHVQRVRVVITPAPQRKKKVKS